MSSSSSSSVSASNVSIPEHFPIKLFIFGVTGQLGQQLIQTLQKQPYANKFEVSVLTRPDTTAPATSNATESKKSVGLSHLKSYHGGVLRVIEGDVAEASVEKLAEWISGSDVVISLLRSYAGRPLDFKLLEAVQCASVPFFVPSLYGADVTAAHITQLPPLMAKRQVIEAVKAASIASQGKLNYIFLQIGLFMEFLPTAFNGVDITNASIIAPYSMDTKITTLTIPDFTQLLLQILQQRNEAHVKNQMLFLGADTESYAQVQKLCEERFGKPFNVSILSKEEITTAVEADKTFQNLIARFRMMYGEQKGVWWPIEQTWNAQHAKHIGLTTLKQHLQTIQA